MEGESVLIDKRLFWVVVIVVVLVLLWVARSMWMKSEKKEGMSDSDMMWRDRMMQLNLQMDPRNSMKAVREGMRGDPALVAAALQ